ncbi:DNA primase [Effusibacillus lacus]|uniref:DNA primase n=1 Tax=Effusibacillus lacus TaxID=1348429 RepID=A0A292YSV0_9BACL|nr:DNA primase [Effusibacillus lacus]TCS70350.1 DNA primase [Effusibacillus lacus]GAX91504.1 DNA primase [Effusibacillus lacus]
MRRIPEEVIEQIRQHFDIVDLISEYVPLKRSGRSFVGLCPFHSEKTPSFSVSPTKQVYHCFGCGAGGNSISFVMHMENLSFVEAVEHLAKRAGIHLPERDESDKDSPEAIRRREMLRCHDLAAKFYHHILLNTEAGVPALQYLQRRGLTLPTIEEFQLGFAPDRWDLLLTFFKKRGFEEEFLERAGLLSASQNQPGRYFDRFRGRVMFPIQDGQGRVIGFGGRILGKGEPKYLNSPETELFQKGRHLYNLHRARPFIRQQGRTILLEGYMDVIMAHQYGIRNVVAALGTALTLEQAKILKRNGNEIVMMYDGDRAGQNASVRSSEVITEAGGVPRVTVLPDGLDPDEFLRKFGTESFERIVEEGTISSTAFKLKMLRSNSQLSTQEGVIAFLSEAVRIIAEAKSPVERETYLRELAGEFNVSLESLKEEMKMVISNQKVGDKPASKWNTNINNGESMFRKAQSPLPAHIQAERKLLSLMLIDPGVARQVKETIVDEFSVEEHAALAVHLYLYYGNHAESNPAHFISRLDDDNLVRLASQLSLEAESTGNRPGLADEYIQRMQMHQAEKRLQLIPKEMEAAAKNGDFETLRHLAQEQIELRKKTR